MNCDPDYRAGSVLNRDGPRMTPVEPPVQLKEPTKAAPAPKVAGGRKSASGPAPRVTASSGSRPPRSAPRRPTPAIASEAQPVKVAAPVKIAPPSVTELPEGVVAAPPGTPEGHTRILSVTDRRADELPAEKPQVAARPTPSPRSEAPSDADLGGWRPVARGPIETAIESPPVQR